MVKCNCHIFFYHLLRLLLTAALRLGLLSWHLLAGLDYLDALIAPHMTRVVDVSGRSVWRCLDCGKEFKLKGDMSRHVEAFHITHPGLQCEVCEKVLKTRESMRSHMNNVHKSASPLKYNFWNQLKHFFVHCMLRREFFNVHSITLQLGVQTMERLIRKLRLWSGGFPRVHLSVTSAATATTPSRTWRNTLKLILKHLAIHVPFVRNTSRLGTVWIPMSALTTGRSGRTY